MSNGELRTVNSERGNAKLDIRTIEELPQTIEELPQTIEAPSQITEELSRTIWYSLA